MFKRVCLHCAIYNPCPVPMLCVRKGVNDGTNWTKWTDNCCQKDSRRKSKYVLYSYKVNEEAFVNKPQCRPARKTINQFGHDAGQDQVVNLVEKYFTIKSSPHPHKLIWAQEKFTMSSCNFCSLLETMFRRYELFGQLIWAQLPAAHMEQGAQMNVCVNWLHNPRHNNGTDYMTT